MDTKKIESCLKQLIEYRNTHLEDAENPEIADKDEFQSFSDEVQGLISSMKEEDDRYIRLLAEFDNYRKRMSTVLDNTRKSAQEEVLKKVLPILDNFYKAVDAIDVDNATATENGMLMAVDTVQKSLDVIGCTAIQPQLGDDFNYDECEAIGMIPSNDVEGGKVCATASVGWKFNGKVVVPAKVVVAQES